MTEQVHKRLNDEQVQMILERFIRKELQSEQAMGLLGLKRSQFFEWVKRYRESKETFTIQYHREGKAREIHPEVEGKILHELKVEKELIEDPTLPIRYYNYSYIRDQLRKKYHYKVSLPTIIDRQNDPASNLPSFPFDRVLFGRLRLHSVNQFKIPLRNPASVKIFSKPVI